MRKRLLLAILMLAALPAWPQAGTGSVRGTVADSSNAVIPDAAVSLTQIATNTVSNTKSNNAGFFAFPGVVPGRYRLHVAVSGMETYQAELTVQVQQAAVVNPVLKVGQVVTQVAVQDVTPLVVSDSPTLGAVLERQRIEQLPLSGRSLTGLLGRIPGMENQRAYALRAGTAEVMVDGADGTDRSWGRLDGGIGLDSIEEFKVESSNSSAKTARPVSLIVTTRTGTNQFHGSLFETMRNSAVGTARARQDFYTKPPQLIRNEFGASAGGPVWLPKLYNGKERTFFFFSYEGSRMVNPTTASYRVPTAAMRNGDFSGLVDSQGRMSNLYDPWSTDSTTWARQQFNYGGKINAIDPSRISPFAKYLFSVTPLPSNPAVNPLVDNNLWTLVPLFNNVNMFTTRVDHRFSEKDRIFGRFSRQNIFARSSINNRGCDAFTENVCRMIDNTNNTTMALSWTHLFSPTFFMEVLANGSDPLALTRAQGELKDWNGQLGLPNPFHKEVFPNINNTGLSNYDVLWPNYNYNKYGNGVADVNLTKLVGRHEMLFGGHYRYEQLNVFFGVQPGGGVLDFATSATSLYDPATSRTNPLAVPYTGANLVNMYLGLANYSVKLMRPPFFLINGEQALYFQDNFKVSPRLTLNLGLRWEYWPPYTQRDGLINSFDKQQRAAVLGAPLAKYYAAQAAAPSAIARFQALGAKFITYDQAGLPASMIDPDPNNFGPRLGLAYRLNNGGRAAILRAGYRISYSSLPTSHWSAWLQGGPTNNYFSNNTLTDAAQAPDGIARWGMRSVPTVVAGVNSTNALSLDAPSGITRGSMINRYFDRNQPSVQVQDWNFTLEKELDSSTLARVAYIGNLSANLPGYFRYNNEIPDYIWYATKGQPLPTGEYSSVGRRMWDQTVYGDQMEYQKWGHASFSGLQLELERRYSKGIGFEAFYVVSNTMGTSPQTIDDVGYAFGTSNYLPGRVPTNPKDEMNFIYYARDTSVPKHRFQWNWIVDLPVGRGKFIGGNIGRNLDRLIGGWQIAGTGSLRSNYFSLPTNVYPTGEGVQIYGYQYPIQDCRSGTCWPGYLWWNGYIPANQINSYGANGKPNGVMGVPDSYKPAAQPLIPYPKVPDPKDPLYSYYGTNTVWVPLQNGAIQRVTYNDQLPPLNFQYARGIRQWGMNASLFKTMPITERIQLRFNADFFNVLNTPGNPNSISGDGILSTRNSGNTPRQLQFTARLSW